MDELLRKIEGLFVRVPALAARLTEIEAAVPLGEAECVDRIQFTVCDRDPPNRRKV